MIKAKIFKVNKVRISEKVQKCHFYIKGEVYIFGIIEIDFIKKEIRLIVKTIKQMSKKKLEKQNLSNRDYAMNLSFEERLCILKEFFYEFFIKEENRVKFLDYHLEEFTFIQESSNTFCNNKSLIQNILMYSIICFDENNKKERLIIALKEIRSNLARREHKRGQRVEAKILPFKICMTDYETYICCEIINRILRNQKYRGRIVDLTVGKYRRYKVFQYLSVGSI